MSKLTVKILKSRLKELGLGLAGRKADLVARLTEALQNPPGGAAAEAEIETEVQAEIEELDMKASNIRRQMANQMEVWESESKTLEMKSERLKEILLDSKKKLNLQEN